MRSGSLLEMLRRGRASFALATLYLLLLPILLGILPKPAPTAEFLLLRDLAAVEICTMPGSGPVPGKPVQHQPECILCSTACPFAGASAAPPPADAAVEPFFVQLALAVPQPKDFALPALGLFTSDIQSRGPPATT
ncbi:hypothetical protein [Taklimakanibacter deserti]|uniref:hypothetical protein n=1 Tax=Taklimakanibacter deserti TaxID=2267839 RepID=UPI000E650954